MLDSLYHILKQFFYVMIVINRIKRMLSGLIEFIKLIAKKR